MPVKLSIEMKRQFAVALSHDVDRVHKSFQSFTHFLKHARKGRVREAMYQACSIARSEAYWCFETICALEAERGLKSTFFFLNETYPFNPLKPRSWRLALGYYNIFAPRVLRKIRQLDTAGYEIGLHGSFRSFSDFTLLKKEKNDLERIVGRPVRGIRQHYLNLAPGTWQAQRSLGFRYDASFGYRHRIGFKDEALHPFPLDDRRDFFIVPQAIMDSCLMRQRHPWDHALELIDFAEQRKALLVLNWHQQVFDEREYPGYAGMYARIVDECLRRRARFATIGEYVDEELARSAALREDQAI